MNFDYLHYHFAFDWMVLTQDLKAIQIISQRKGQGSTSAYQYSYVRQSYKPIIILSVSIVLRVVWKVLLDYFSGFQSYKLLFLLNSRTINTVVKIIASQVLHFIGLSIHQSIPVYRKSYFLQDYRYTSQNQCIVSPILCRTIDTLVKTSVSSVLSNVGLSIHQSRLVYRKS